jgi:hypothetical protein
MKSHIVYPMSWMMAILLHISSMFGIENIKSISFHELEGNFSLGWSPTFGTCGEHCNTLNIQQEVSHS